MDVEIEAKLKVDSLDEVEAQLRSLGATFVAIQNQTDQHFDDSRRSMADNDKCLRLRKQDVEGRVKHILTYKGPQQKSNVKKRQENEVEVTDAAQAAKILAALGYSPRLTVKKRRGMWRFEGCEIALDSVEGLGTFVEIEGPADERITKVQQKLGLSERPHITRSYVGMIAEKAAAKQTE